MQTFGFMVKALACGTIFGFTAARPVDDFTVPEVAFNSTYLFTARVLLGPPPKGLGANPIAIPGGVIVPEPILGGRVNGPYMNGTISSGLATPRVYRKDTLQEPVIDLYGHSSDGLPFSLHEEGIGNPEAQVTRLSISIGGGSLYDLLNTGYVLATVNPNVERTEVVVHGYLIRNTVML